jgi:predicted CXXCH cytochrome family protein
MKKLITGFAAVSLLIFVAAASHAALPTAHDFTSGYGLWDASELNDGACMACHVPHNAVASTPLWATRAPAALTLRGGASAGADTNFCMSCHDGVTAIGGAVAMAAGVRNLGQDLTDDHPVGVAWSVGGLPGTRAQALAESNLGLADGDLATLECTSCHNAHGGNAKMVRATAGMCVDCHDPGSVGQP